MLKDLELEMMNLDYTPINEVFPDAEEIALHPHEVFPDMETVRAEIESSTWHLSQEEPQFTYDEPVPQPHEEPSTSYKKEFPICTGKQRMTLQKLRKQLGLSLLSKQKLDTMSVAVVSQLITDYIQLIKRGA